MIYKMRLFVAVMAIAVLIVGCEKSGIRLDDSPLMNSVEVVNRTPYDIERISYAGREKRCLWGPLIPAGTAQYVQCKKIGSFKLSPVDLRVFCGGRWSKLILWSGPKQKYLKLRCSWPILFADEFGNVEDADGRGYNRFVDISFNQTLYVEDWDGDVVLTNRRKN